MKIAVLTTSFPRWAGDYFGSYVFDVAAAHVRKGAQVRVVAPHAEGARDRELLDGVEVLRFRYALPPSLQVLAYGGGIFTNLRGSFRARLQLPVFFLGFLLRSLSVVLWADVVHAHWTLAGFVGVVLARLLRKRSVLTLHGIEVFTARARALTKLCVGWADHVICNSRATEARMREMVGPRCPTSSSVIPFGISEDFASGGKSDFELRAHHGVPAGYPIILSLGRLIERKGIEYLLRSVPVVLRKSRAHFVIAGEGPERPRLEALAAELGVKHSVTFVGAIPSSLLPSYYDQCDIFVHPIVTDATGDMEGLGIVLLEAMACGKPVVASGIGGITDIVIDGETGYLVPEKDVEALAARVSALALDPRLRGRMGNFGQERVDRQFRLEHLADRTMQVYSGLA